jgi:hypothetical protein
MKQVRVLGDYANDRYCMAGKQYMFTPYQTPDDIRDEIPTLCVNQAAKIKSLDEDTARELSLYDDSGSKSEYESTLQTVHQQACADMEYDASSEEEEFADASDEMEQREYGEAESGNGRRH